MLTEYNCFIKLLGDTLETKGRILKGVGGLYTVLLTDGETVNCRARGALRHEGEKPLTGDYVTLTHDGEYSIYEIIDRRNSLIRPPLANLDVLFTVVAAAKPAPVITTLDKLISIGEHNAIEPVVIITKADIDPENSANLAETYKRCGFDAFVTENGTAPADLTKYLEEKCDGCTCAFAGNSGVGKSTLINSLFPDLQLETGGISRKIERGKHTTRVVELYGVKCGEAELFIADTPGFSMLDFTRFDFFTKDELKFTFREFAPYLDKCRYADCTHTREGAAECSVAQAVKDGIIPQSRHESFLSMWDDLKDKPDWK